MWMMLYTIIYDIFIIWPISMVIVYFVMVRDKIGTIEFILFFRGFANNDPRSLVTYSF